MRVQEEKTIPKNKLKGIFVPHLTPFKRNGEIDEEALRACVQFWVKSGLHGLVVCGSNGEAPYLSREERKTVIGAVIDEVNGKVPVIAGTGSMSTWETIVFTGDAKDLGVDAALVVTPFYFKLANREIYEHYKTILEAVDLPLILYSVPKFTGFDLDLSVISQLASEYENVVGVKDSGGSMSRITQVIGSVGDRMSVLAGTAGLALPTLLLGGKGAVIAVANAIPALCVNMYEAFERRDYETASKLQRHITCVNELLMRYGQVSAIKAALTLLGLPGGYPRKPVLPLGKEEENAFERLLKPILKPS
jgi:4-hydroxy-tetrahydrodipicolinate synthase